jgi:hypothetical protein
MSGLKKMSITAMGYFRGMLTRIVTPEAGGTGGITDA